MTTPAAGWTVDDQNIDVVAANLAAAILGKISGINLTAEMIAGNDEFVNELIGVAINLHSLVKKRLIEDKDPVTAALRHLRAKEGG